MPPFLLLPQPHDAVDQTESEQRIKLSPSNGTPPSPKSVPTRSAPTVSRSRQPSSQPRLTMVPATVAEIGPWSTLLKNGIWDCRITHVATRLSAETPKAAPSHARAFSSTSGPTSLLTFPSRYAHAADGRT